MSSTFFDSKNNEIKLGHKIGSGGEGAVFEIVGQSTFVAKIYHENISAKKEEKLKGMARLKTEQLQNVAAWPMEILQNKKGKIAGFIMPKIYGYKPIHELYSPKSRRQEFPHADWRFLLHVATNAARALSVVHKHGHVVGDLNHGNLVVSANGMVKLIDTDSFQVSIENNTFLCEVGVVEYTPPELHGKDFQSTPRDANHDAFGLAILMFHLLFMGRHPFAGKFLGHGEMPIYKAIRENRFAYSSQAKKFQMQPPPFTLPNSTVPAELFQLFEKAFLAGTAYGTDRPKPTDWIESLTRFSNNIKTCNINTSHHYFSALLTCPWCELEKKLGADLFVVKQVQFNVGAFNLNVAWARIEAVKSPGKTPSLPKIQAQPTQIAKTVKKQQIIYRGSAILTVILSFFVGYLFLSQSMLFAPFIIGILVAYWLWRKGGIKNKIRLNYTVAEGKLRTAKQEWENDASDKKFVKKFLQLEAEKIEYADLPDHRNREMANLKTKLREKQLERFLEQFRITDTKFENIGVERKTMLLSYGIENASDINKKAIKAVPGFGKVLTEKLLEWRVELETKFVFNLYKGVDPRDIADLDRHIGLRKKMLENNLTQGAIELTKIREQIILARERLRSKMEFALNDFAQAEADWNYVNALI